MPRYCVDCGTITATGNRCPRHMTTNRANDDRVVMPVDYFLSDDEWSDLIARLEGCDARREHRAVGETPAERARARRSGA